MDSGIVKTVGRRQLSFSPQIHESFPSIGASPKGAHARDSMDLEEQRRTGAGGFVRSTAKENDLAVAGNLLRVCSQVLNGEADRTGDRARTVFQAAPQVHNIRILAGIHAAEQFLRRD